MNAISDTFTATFTATITSLIDSCYEDLSARFTTRRIRRSPAFVGIEGGDGPSLSVQVELRGDYYVPAIYLRQAWRSTSMVALDDDSIANEKDIARENLSAVGLAELWMGCFGKLSWNRHEAHDSDKLAEASRQAAARRELTEARAQADSDKKLDVLRKVHAGDKLSAYEGTQARGMKLLVVTEGKVRKLTALGYLVLGLEPPTASASLPPAIELPATEPEPGANDAAPAVEPAAVEPVELTVELDPDSKPEADQPIVAIVPEADAAAPEAAPEAAAAPEAKPAGARSRSRNRGSRGEKAGKAAAA